MSALYIHIPFCKSKCHYCNFFSTVSLKYKSELVDSILIELEQKKNYLSNNNLDTIYFGGGTPSILSNLELSSIFKKIHEIYTVNSDCEITFEANPDDISKEKLILYKELGINRLSIGIQSFNDKILAQLNRNHSAQEAINAVILAKEYGFNNMNIDLIYGIPGLTESIWKEELEKFMEFDIPHLSAYALTVEPKTALNYLINKNKYPNLNEDESITHFNYLISYLNDHKYNQYEISNFSIEGFESKHNSNYWKNNEYLGIGPSANSYNIVSRQWNSSSIKNYINEINDKTNYFGIEFLTLDEQFNEYVMLGLRTNWGIDLEIINSRFGQNYLEYLIEYFSKNLIKFDKKGNIVVLSKNYRMLADGIASDIFK